MKTILIYFLALFALSKTEEVASTTRKKRGSFRTSYPLGNNLHIAGIDVETFGKSTPTITVEDTGLFAPQERRYNRIPTYDFGTQLIELPQISYPVSNNLDKPVRERQEYIPPQAVGSAIIPQLPPPATPVNAAASNVPANGNSVFLGSGALGVIDLGGGAYALGSGSLGYSERRQNPRPNIRSPLLPPVQAAPNLIPAAVSNPTQQPQINQIPQVQQRSGSQPQLPTDQNGYEYLPPDRVGFGDPLPQRPLKVTNSFATSTLLQLPQSQIPQHQQIPQLPQIQIGQFQQFQPIQQIPTASSLPDTQSIFGQQIQDVSKVFASHYLR